MYVRFTIFFLFVLPSMFCPAQQFPDSLRKALRFAKVDSIVYGTIIQLYNYYEELNRDSAFYYAEQSVQISRRNKKKINEAYSLSRKAYQELNTGRYAEALHSLMDAFAISEDAGNDQYYWSVEPLKHASQNRLYALSCTHHIFAILMRETQNLEQQIFHFKEAKKLALEINNPARALLGSLNLGRIYLDTHNLDSALYFENEAEEIAVSSGRLKYLSTIKLLKGNINAEKGDTASALSNFYECIRSGIEQNNRDGLVRGYRELSVYHQTRNNLDSALYYAAKQVSVSKELGTISNTGYHIGVAYENLYLVYQSSRRFDSAYKYLALAKSVTDSINLSRIQSLAEFQSLTLKEQQRSQNIEKEKIAYQNRIRTYFLLSGIGVLLLLAIIFYRNNLQKQKAKSEIEEAYNHLKSTQQQLIQSEKMASLGELTSGIAHEIQNPLNFVNNFSEVNRELLVEMKQELQKGRLHEVDAITDDLISNEEKISHHGKRADAIVKGMLQHSRATTGQKELTDINGLTDEYVKLAFHGYRGKDSSFETKVNTEFDPSIGEVQIAPHEIGRVLLNLLNNAFFAVNERKKTEQGGLYVPVVSVSTKKSAGNLQISVQDNGYGISQKIVDKIFQPFFTTKPTGQGTGLGLSLAYDIVKAHGGEIKVNSIEGHGSEFIITLNAKL